MTYALSHFILYFLLDENKSLSYTESARLMLRARKEEERRHCAGVTPACAKAGARATSCCAVTLEPLLRVSLWSRMFSNEATSAEQLLGTADR